jgi:nitrate reductase gamma subunit
MDFMDLPIANILIDVGGLILLLLVLAGIAYRIKKGTLRHFFHWKVFERPNGKEEHSNQVAYGALSVLFREAFVFKVLGTCDRLKRASHILVFWGFVFLAISTTLAFLTNPNNVVLPLYNPVKVFGNAGGALVIAGFVGMFYVRYRERAPIWRLTRSDLFLLTLFLAVVTGFVTQQTIYSGFASIWVAYSFWIHMVLVVLLLATAPFTKFYHAVSKPFYLLYEEMDKRGKVEQNLPEPVSNVNDSVESNKS